MATLELIANLKGTAGTAPTDATVAPIVASGTLTGAALSAKIGTLTQSLYPVSGESNTATRTRLNSALSAASAFGARRAVKLVGDYTINGPLTVYSNTKLDLSEATITLAAASGTNIIKNRAATTTQRVVNDAVLSNASTTMTSATAAFTSADVGRAVLIPNGIGASGPLCTLIASVTNATTVELLAPAQANVAAGTLNIYDLDRDIEVIGGNIDRGANVGAGTDLHSMLFRRVVGLRTTGQHIRSTAGKYGISIGSAYRFTITDIDLDVSSDGVHVEGDSYYGSISNIKGKTGDDFVAFTARSRPTYTPYEDVAGDITDMEVEGLFIEGSLSPVKLLGGTSTKVRRIFIKNVTGKNFITLNVGAELQSDYPCDIDDVYIDGVYSGATAPVTIAGSNCGHVSVSNVTSTSTTAYCAVAVTSTAACRSLSVDNVDMKNTPANSSVVFFQGVAATVQQLRVSNVDFTASGSSYVVKAMAGGATITACYLANIFIPTGGFVSVVAGTLGTLEMVNCRSVSASWIADLGTVTTLLMSNVQNLTPTSGAFNIRATGDVRIKGAGNDIYGNLSISAGGRITSYTDDLPYSATAGAVPVLTALGAAGTGATATVVGSDRSGTITLTAGSGAISTGESVQIAFTRNHPSAPRNIQLTPTNAAAVAVGAFVTNKAAGAFRIATTVAPATSAVLTFDYLVNV